MAVEKKHAMFSQGDSADAVFYLQKGRVRLTVFSKADRSRVSFFMNRFRKTGFINYSGGEGGGLQVHSSLLNVGLHD